MHDEDEEYISDEENIQDKLQSFLGKIPENFSILEEEIDVDIQMEYFKFAKKIKRSNNKDALLQEDLLYNNETSENDKKTIVVKLAGIDDPKAFRIIEKFKAFQKGKELFEWTAMAYQESLMLMQGALLEENQIFISTGMGGKGKKLRYFVAFIPENGTAFTKTQTNLIKSEVEYSFLNTECEIETFNVSEKYLTLTTLMPLQVNIKQIFSEAIYECNQIGNFISENFIVTNVKKLTDKEIEDFIKKSNKEGEINELNISLE